MKRFMSGNRYYKFIMLVLFLTAFFGCSSDDGEKKSPPSIDPPQSAETTVEVPTLISLTEEEANNELTNADLVLGGVTKVNSIVIPAGSVVSQQPKAGVVVDVKSAVDLVISLGAPVNLTAPNVVGLTQSDASTSIANSGS